MVDSPSKDLEFVLRSQIGMVIQETILFQDTIANNIAYGFPHAARAAIEPAVTAAAIDKRTEHQTEKLVAELECPDRRVGRDFA